jgi:hypothetical protein
MPLPARRHTTKRARSRERVSRVTGSVLALMLALSSLPACATIAGIEEGHPAGSAGSGGAAAPADAAQDASLEADADASLEPVDELEVAGPDEPDAEPETLEEPDAGFEAADDVEGEPDSAPEDAAEADAGAERDATADADATTDPDVSLPADADAGSEADAAKDVSVEPDVTDAAQEPEAGDAADAPDAPCEAGSKLCSGKCVSLDDPSYGCAASSCSGCVLQNAVPKCTQGACDVGMCSIGWGNCDGKVSNGCEADLVTSPGHCGNCQTTCPPPQWCVGGGCCAPLGAECQAGPACCAGAGVCGPLLRCCRMGGESCQGNNECCTGTCLTGTCCRPVHAACDPGLIQCCQGLGCAASKCCALPGTFCANSADCCGGFCSNNACCRPPTVKCNVPTDCCSLKCGGPGPTATCQP